ncbi:MAG: hypothetical protein BWX86_02860 [Verrucomicrobia bacterium ADurb.Bin122]|nr:MAG: hypothetical protein BWX86_02860 [Verrucomicrobia bacterium ADurb.Bin122]
MRVAAAHHAGVGLDRDGEHADAFKEFLVGRLHHEVALHRVVVGGVERVRIHHDELAGAHQAVARADLVTELGRDLVEILREVAVAGNLRLHERGDDLFVSRAEHKLGLLGASLAGAGMVDAVHDLACGSPARALLPRLHRMDVRHPQLDGAGGIHLLATRLGDLVDRTQAKRHVRVEATAQLAHEAGAHEQFMGSDLGVGRAFLERGDVKLGPVFHEVRQRNSAPRPEQIYLRRAPSNHAT